MAHHFIGFATEYAHSAGRDLGRQPRPHLLACHHRGDPVKKRTMGRRSKGEAVEQAAPDRWQYRLKLEHFLTSPHVDIHLQPSIEIETDRRVLRTHVLQHAEYPV
jgi:hypothetical protein